MATALNVVNEWASDSEEKQLLVKQQGGLVLRWLNEAQLRFVSNGNTLRDVWSPTITSTGSIALPSDFIREIPDLVKYDASTTNGRTLSRVDYAVAFNSTFSGTNYYSVHNGSFYVWSAGALTPSIVYYKKPAALTVLASDSLSVDTANHSNIVDYLEAKWLYRKKEIRYPEYMAMMGEFDNQAKVAGIEFLVATDSMVVRSGGI